MALCDGLHYAAFVMQCASLCRTDCDGAALRRIVAGCVSTLAAAEERAGCGCDSGCTSGFNALLQRVDAGLAGCTGKVGLFVGASGAVGGDVEGGARSTGDFSSEHGSQERRCGRVGVVEVGDCSEGVSGSSSGGVRGGNYWRNKRKRDNKKRKMQRDWRSGFDRQKEDVESDATVVTVDTKMAEEVQAKRSLAVRRTMENRVATALAAHKLRTLKDKSRTDAVEKLAAARFEQRINEAKAKSQSSFKQCDQSLKSLGSSGSAGEFALKQEVKRAQDDRKLLDYVQKQLDIAIKCATPAAIAAINALPAPEFQDEFEAFGDCPSDYDEDEAQAYYNQLNARNQELADIANVGF